MVSRVRRQVKNSGSYLLILLLCSVFMTVVSVFASSSLGNLTNSIATLSFGNVVWTVLFIALLFACQCALEYAYHTIRGKFSPTQAAVYRINVAKV